MTSQRRKDRGKLGGSGVLFSVFGVSVTFQNNSWSQVLAAQTESCANATCWFVGSESGRQPRPLQRKNEDKI
jgi:hypothetical protein